jgi:hypothetical protein
LIFIDDEKTAVGLDGGMYRRMEKHTRRRVSWLIIFV